MIARRHPCSTRVFVPPSRQVMLTEGTCPFTPGACRPRGNTFQAWTLIGLPTIIHPPIAKPNLGARRLLAAYLFCTTALVPRSTNGHSFRPVELEGGCAPCFYLMIRLWNIGVRCAHMTAASITCRMPLRPSHFLVNLAPPASSLSPRRRHKTGTFWSAFPKAPFFLSLHSIYLLRVSQPGGWAN